MRTYLFVTQPEYTPERVERGFDVPWWSCSSTTEEGDRVFVFVAGVGLQYEWRVTSNATRNDEWKFICDVEHVRSFNPVITIQELRKAFPKDVWYPPHRLGGVKSILIPEPVVARILALRPPPGVPRAAVSQVS